MLFFDDFHFDDTHDHLHVTKDSKAIDTDGDGYSDAVEKKLGTNAYDSLGHPTTHENVLGVGGGVSTVKIPDDLSRAFDTDGDGISDIIERKFGSSPLDPHDHPDVVEAHHFKLHDVKIGDALDRTVDSKFVK